MAQSAPLPRFRTIPLMASPRGHPPWVRPALFITLGLFGLLRWHDVGGATAIRFRLVSSALGSFARLADSAADLGGYPLDAVLTLPFTWLAGSWPAVAGALWTAAAGATMAWLVSAWWGSATAGTAAGVAWMLTLGPSLALADTAALAALAILPLAWGLTLRALERGPLDVLGAIVASGALIANSAGESRALLLLFAATAGVAARAPDARRQIATLFGILAGAVVLAAPALTLRAATTLAPGTSLLEPLLAIAALLALWPARKQGARLLLPICAVMSGLGPVHGTAAAAVGLICVAAGGVIPLLQVTTRLARRRTGDGNT